MRSSDVSGRVGVVVGDGAVGKVGFTCGAASRFTYEHMINLDLSADLVHDQRIPGELLRLALGVPFGHRCTESYVPHLGGVHPDWYVATIVHVTWY